VHHQAVRIKCAQSGYAQSGYAQSGYAQSGYAQSGYAQSGYSLHCYSCHAERLPWLPLLFQLSPQTSTDVSYAGQAPGQTDAQPDQPNTQIPTAVPSSALATEKAIEQSVEAEKPAGNCLGFGSTKVRHAAGTLGMPWLGLVWTIRHSHSKCCLQDV